MRPAICLFSLMLMLFFISVSNAQTYEIRGRRVNLGGTSPTVYNVHGTGQPRTRPVRLMTVEEAVRDRQERERAVTVSSEPEPTVTREILTSSTTPQRTSIPASVNRISNAQIPRVANVPQRLNLPSNLNNRSPITIGRNFSVRDPGGTTQFQTGSFAVQRTTRGPNNSETRNRWSRGGFSSTTHQGGNVTHYRVGRNGTTYSSRQRNNRGGSNHVRFNPNGYSIGTSGQNGGIRFGSSNGRPYTVIRIGNFRYRF